MSEEDDITNAIPCKVVLIGEGEVGKSTIISRYITKKFDPSIERTKIINFYTKTAFIEDENQYIKYVIWDTAGQEKFRSLAKSFYKDADVCILVYDITRNQSLEELKKYWINEIKNNASKKISKKIKKINYLLN